MSFSSSILVNLNSNQMVLSESNQTNYQLKNFYKKDYLTHQLPENRSIFKS